MFDIQLVPVEDLAADEDTYEDQTKRELVNGLFDDVRALGARHLVQLKRIAHLEARRVWRDDDCRDMAQWVALNLGIGSHRGRRMTDCARKLDRLPRIAEALETGVLSLDKTVELTRFATPETERTLITWAKRVAPSTIARRADAECAKDTEETREERATRYLRWRREGDNTWLEALLPADQGAFVTQAIAKLADQLPKLPTEDLPHWCSESDLVDQRRADALYLLARSDGSDRLKTPEVVVHTTLSAVGEFSNGKLASGGTLHPDVVAKLACDARLRFVLTEEEGNPLGIGRASRIIPEWLRQEVLEFYDFTCAYPCCDRRAFLEVHHSSHWAHGGPSDFDWLFPVCSSHHDLLHLYLWNAYRMKDGEVVWVKPNGERYLPGPAPPVRA